MGAQGWASALWAMVIHAGAHWAAGVRMHAHCTRPPTHPYTHTRACTHRHAHLNTQTHACTHPMHTHTHTLACVLTGNGSMVGAIMGSTKQEPHTVGKPSEFMLENIATTFKLERSEICMVRGNAPPVGSIVRTIRQCGRIRDLGVQGAGSRVLHVLKQAFSALHGSCWMGGECEEVGCSTRLKKRTFSGSSSCL